MPLKHNKNKYLQKTHKFFYGRISPTQIIYGGKTDKCQPVFKFLSDWNITHSENHWANTATQMDYVKTIILPYIRKVHRTHVVVCVLVSINLPTGARVAQ